MRKLLAAIMVLAAGHPAAAHDFWLLPDTFRAKVDQPVTIAFKVGHGTEVEPWNLGWNSLHSFYSYGPGGLVDQQAGIVPNSETNPGAGTVRLAGEGTHIVVTETYHATSILPADKFTDYAKLEGLAAALETREAAGTTDTPGRELYSRRAKTLVQVGDTLTDAITRPLGLTLEIVPDRNPYAPSTGNRLPVRVFFQGKPLPGALIDLTALDLGTEPFQGQRTDAQGRASFEVPRVGAWKINVIWARPAEGREGIDFDTVFASLTFGFPVGSRPR